ncbi:MAG: hypothetical protein ACKO2L_06550 [Planctomycetaceae bacterium]
MKCQVNTSPRARRPVRAVLRGFRDIRGRQAGADAYAGGGGCVEVVEVVDGTGTFLVHRNYAFTATPVPRRARKSRHPNNALPEIC